MRKCVFTTAITILCLFVGFGMASAADTFKIGGLVPVTGTQAVMAEDLATGLKLAEEEVNAAGGVLGKPIKVIIEDTETRPAPGMDAARKLIDVDKVSVLTGGFSSGVSLCCCRSYFSALR
jgi:branched-chain amino acid transport system substrate-binding protein